MLFETFPDGGVLVHDDWSTNMKIRTSVDITPEQWRSAKDAAIHNFLIRFIAGKNESGGFIFEEHAIHFLCDVAGTETVASALNFDNVVKYILDNAKYKVKTILRWTDGTSKQFKNNGTFGKEKLIAINFDITIVHNFFITNWGKGKIDLLGGIVHHIYSQIVRDLLERSNDLKLVCDYANSKYSSPGSTRAESSLTRRQFFYVSKDENDAAKSSRTTWHTLTFPDGVPLFSDEI